MTYGLNRLRVLGLLPTPCRCGVYTSLSCTSSIHISDVQPMPSPPRDTAVPRLRWDLVVRVRREIEAGTYETPEKWEIALDRLQADLERDLPLRNLDEHPA
jgi:hypothetical protein